MYIILLLYLFFIIANNEKLKRNKKFDTHYHILLLLTVLMAGLSYRMGYDSLKYEDSFYFFSNKLRDIGSEISSYGFREPGWVALNVIVNTIFGEFVYLKIFIALFVNTIIFWFFKKHLSNPGVGILLYFFLTGWNINFEILRASIAIGFFLIAIDKVLNEKRNIFAFYLWLLPSLLFHWFAFLMIITPVFFLFKPNKTFIFILGGAAMLSPLLISIGLNYDIGLFSQVMGERVDIYLTGDSWGDRNLNLVGVAFSVVTTTIPVLLLCYSHKKDVDPQILSISLAYALFTILRMGLDILYRINDYYIFVTIILIAISIPKVCVKGKIRVKGKIIDIICIGLMIISIAVTITPKKNWKRYVPYTSIFDKTTIPERESIYYDLGYEDNPLVRKAQ